MRNFRFLLCFCVVATALLVPLRAEAQLLAIPRFDFSFSNPGARSLGFGGAFSALADDATAAYANPAGLVKLTEPEVSLEARLESRSSRALLDGSSSGNTNDDDPVNTAGFVSGRNRTEDIGLSFASVVIPKEKWSFAFYGHQLADTQQSAESQGFFFFDQTPTEAFGILAPTRETLELEITSVGAAAAWRIGDKLSLGLGLVLSQTSLNTNSRAFLPISDDPDGDVPGGDIPDGDVPDGDNPDSGPPETGTPFQPERRVSTTAISATGTDLGFNMGLLWLPSDQLSAALFYRRGPRVDGKLDFETGPASPIESRFQSNAVFDAPDVFGAGLAYRLEGGRVTLASEFDWVTFSGLVQIAPRENTNLEGRSYRDAWNFRAGAEYALIKRTPILAFRAGFWVESDGQDRLEDKLIHTTVGLGIAAETLQIDLAGDFSYDVDRLSLSFIYRF